MELMPYQTNPEPENNFSSQMNGYLTEAILGKGENKNVIL